MRAASLAAVAAFLLASCLDLVEETPGRSDPGTIREATIADIRIDGLSSRIDGNYLYITGRLINSSDYPTGVEVKITSYDQGGQVLTVSDSWPASISNIPPHSDYPFETMLDYLPGHDRIETRVIRVNRWD